MPNDVKLYPLPVWTRIEITGADRQTFINNFCTNNIRTLVEGAGLEAFITDIKGHVLGHGWFWALENELLFDTVPGQGGVLIAHWDRYLIRERVEFEDRTEATAFWCLAGHAAALVLAHFGSTPLQVMQTRQLQIAGCMVLAAHLPWLREPAWFLSCKAKFRPLVEDALLAAGVTKETTADWNSARIAARLPLYGQDITVENLPQELARDKQAISFTKGCYLGQEPIARIDALGHVNKLLVGLRAIPPVNAEVALPLELMVDGKTIGKVTSLASGLAVTTDVPTALGIVRRAQAKAGTIVESSAGQFEVV